MTKGFEEDFSTIEILIKSNTKTGRTDAFVVAYTKLEKQARRIFTYMVYQYPAFSLQNYGEIVDIIVSKKYLDFDNFIKGFDALYPKSFESLAGKELYRSFINADFPRIKVYRNKIIHGQPTGHSLDAGDLKKEICIIKTWCSRIAESMMAEICFDGFEWNSFRKNKGKNLASTYKTEISTAEELDAFIEAKMK